CSVIKRGVFIFEKWLGGVVDGVGGVEGEFFGKLRWGCFLVESVGWWGGRCEVCEGGVEGGWWGEEGCQ
uniref:hypothetical protein n=1 Tax=Cytobacillus oceanisediminis TaxID=665099 RepID=UPI001C92D1D0